jgi:poly(hydroxyalkanoate) depolymerase family esterase
MFDNVADGVRKATDLTKAGRLIGATAEIQRFLQRGIPSLRQSTNATGLPSQITGQATLVNLPEAATGGGGPQSPLGRLAGMPTGDGVRRGKNRASPGLAMPRGAHFLSQIFTGDAGYRPYKLYVPSGYDARRLHPLIIMLHGCTQTPDDFAAGTRMNLLAEANNFLVAYPEQTRSANMQKCWNWFNATDQVRNAGEPSLIAGITRAVMSYYAVDPAQVFVAGLSAGGAAAAIMGQTYPDLYVAIGIHSGLACGAAPDMPSAFVAMRQGAAGSATELALPTIVFHGDSDTTVNPRNSDAIIDRLSAADIGKPRVNTEQVPGGRFYTRTVYTNAAGSTVAEQWRIRGAPHAWSGGCASGSYTDPLGPDASAEMLRFFREIAANKTLRS